MSDRLDPPAMRLALKAYEDSASDRIPRRKHVTGDKPHLFTTNSINDFPAVGSSVFSFLFA